MAKQRLIEGGNIVAGGGGHFLQDIRMATNCPLTKDNHAAGQNVRAFHGDSDGRTLIGTRQEVAVTQHDALTTRDIHRIDD